MPKDQNFYDYLPKISTLSLKEISLWLKRGEDGRILENELGNKILYPRAVAISEKDMMFDLAILREVIKANPGNYYNLTFNKINIPGDFLTRIPDIFKIVLAFIDVIEPENITSVFLRSEIGVRQLGTVIRPIIKSEKGVIILLVSGEKYQIEIGSLATIPMDNRRIDIKFESDTAILLGKHSVSTEIMGGEMGLVVDTRKQSYVKNG